MRGLWTVSAVATRHILGRGNRGLKSTAIVRCRYATKTPNTNGFLLVTRCGFCEIAGMANTFASLYVHVVFSSKNRAPHIAAEIEDDVWRYLGGICRTHGVKACKSAGGGPRPPSFELWPDVGVERFL